MGGRLASLDAIAEHGDIFFAPNEHAKKINYWGRKSTGPSMVGIIAKMASKPERAEKLGLRMCVSSAKRNKRMVCIVSK